MESVQRSTQAADSKLRLGDQVEIRFDTGGGQAAAPQAQQAIVDEKGEISLALVGCVQAQGLTRTELAQRIQSLYVPKFYVQCNVTVLTSERFFYVGGEVRQTGRFPWSEDVTLLRAIHVAGSFTEYANHRNVELTRGQQKVVLDAEIARRDPKKDIAVLPGDSIWVARTIW